MACEKKLGLKAEGLKIAKHFAPISPAVTTAGRLVSLVFSFLNRSVYSAMDGKAVRIRSGDIRHGSDIAGHSGSSKRNKT